MGSFMRGGLGLTAFFALAMWLYGCSKGTEIEDPWDVAGSVQHPDGETAVGVRVTAIRVDDSRAKRGSAADPDYVQAVVESSTNTDNEGVYRFKNLPKGEYTIYFDYHDSVNPENNQALRVEKVYVNPDWRQRVEKATLGAASTLIAKAVNGVSNEPVEGAACRIENTPYRATTGETGLLLLYTLHGQYRMVCEKGELKSLPYEINLDSGGRDEPTIPMYTGGKEVSIPMPSNVAANLDTANGFIRVSWTNPPTSETLDYWVRRTDLLGGPSKSWIVEPGDSTFNDNVFADEPETVLFRSVQYAVFCSRKAVNQIGKYALSKTVNAVRGPTIKSGFLDTALTTCTEGDSAMLLGTYSSRFHINSKVLWRLPDSAGAWDTLKVTEIANQSGRDTLAFPCMVPGVPPIEFLVKDATGALAIDRFKFEIISKP